MKTIVNLETKDVREIIAKYLGIPEDDVIPNRYSFGIANMTIGQIEAKLKGDA